MTAIAKSWAGLDGAPVSASARNNVSASRADVSARFEIAPEVAQRFNAYAAFAFPYEIGGILRIEQPEPGVFRATDLKVFKQKVTGAYFELDPMALAEFTMELVNSGRANEIQQWKSLIHSHPAMTPQMSGTDRENIEVLAGQSFAFSVICSAQQDPDRNYYAVHYCQAAPAKMIVHNLPVRTDKGASLSGVDLLDDRTLQEIHIEVGKLCTQMIPDLSTLQAAVGRHDQLTVSDMFDADDDSGGDASGGADGFSLDDEFGPDGAGDVDGDFVFDSASLSDVQYEICDTALFVLQETENSGYDDEDISSLRALLTGNEPLTLEETLILADALHVYVRDADDDERRIAERLRVRFEDMAFEAVHSDPSDADGSGVNGIAGHAVVRSPAVSEFVARQVQATALKDQAAAAERDGDLEAAERMRAVVRKIAGMFELDDDDRAVLAQALEAEIGVCERQGAGRTLKCVGLREALETLTGQNAAAPAPVGVSGPAPASGDLDGPFEHPQVVALIVAAADRPGTVRAVGERQMRALVDRVADAEPFDGDDMHALRTLISAERSAAAADGDTDRLAVIAAAQDALGITEDA